MPTQWYQAVHLTKRFRLGTQKKDIAGNVYVYAKGVASTAVGDFVVFDETFTTARLSTSTAVAAPAAVAMAANILATTFSWYQVYGNGSAMAAGTVAADAQLQSTATAGAVDDTTTAAKTIVGAFSTAASTIGVALPVWLNWPFYENAAIV